MKTITFAGKSRLSLLVLLVGLLCFVAPKARADDEKDPPTRVARISYVDGSVSLQPGGEGDWGSAAKNRPMTIGDKLWVDKDSRAELQAGVVAIHLGSMTAVSFLNLDEGMTQVRLAEGAVNFRVRELRQGDVCEVDTPNVSFTVKQAGAFRIDVDENGDATRVMVLRGEGEVTAGGKTYEVHAGERGEFNGTDDVTYTISKASGLDGLDRWSEERDRTEDNSPSAKYVSRDMDGYADLDQNGTWSETPDQGAVWYPNDVSPDWAPYSNGNWDYVEPWGWTWVGYEPWGFAPYHYGRWNYFGGRWGWCPGPYGYPVYGPAFVGFFGGGFGFGIGWFPLGFGEPFFPWFHCGRGFVERINVRNTFIRDRNVFNTNVRNFNYVNAHNVHAVTVANRDAFGKSQMINRGAFHVTEASLKGARVTNSVGIKPTQHSSLGAANVNSHVARPSSTIQNRSVMARTTPAQGASHAPVRMTNNTAISAGRPNTGTGNSPMTSRQRELSQSRPPSAMGNRAGQGTANNGRTWEAQGNTSDRGRPPLGFGSSNRPANTPSQNTPATQGNRPPWAGNGANNQGARPSAPNYNNRPNYSNGGSANQPRSYNPPARSYSPPSRTYSAPSRSYPAPSRSYSAPSRSYSAPSHSSSAPSHSSGGGGGNHSSGGGGGSHSSGGGSGGSHGGGGGHGRP
jgi:hypothetical protein